MLLMISILVYFYAYWKWFILATSPWGIYYDANITYIRTKQEVGSLMIITRGRKPHPINEKAKLIPAPKTKTFPAGRISKKTSGPIV